MELPKDDTFEDVEVIRKTDGYTDEETGQWVSASEEVVAVGKMDIQPQSGSKRAEKTGTDYESDYTSFAGSDDVEFNEGYSKIKRGDIIKTVDNKYEVVFPGDWTTHYECDLKEQ